MACAQKKAGFNPAFLHSGIGPNRQFPFGGVFFAE
jgi:hypothetical protein